MGQCQPSLAATCEGATDMIPRGHVTEWRDAGRGGSSHCILGVADSLQMPGLTLCWQQRWDTCADPVCLPERMPGQPVGSAKSLALS